MVTVKVASRHMAIGVGPAEFHRHQLKGAF